ncbi:MAG: DUF5615 family PIN-like protein [Planctomycetes bacterium]|nr:DUF5615 family PIN-like protein [Planctomycetota bacterium]
MFDENLSPELPVKLGDLFARSKHIYDFNYDGMPDIEIWRLAAEQDLCIVSCDQDFYRLSFNRGAPPKVLWLRVPRSDTEAIEACIRRNKRRINRFLRSKSESLLVLK